MINAKATDDVRIERIGTGAVTASGADWLMYREHYFKSLEKTWRDLRTARGFQRIDFTDANDVKCSIQQSSAILECSEYAMKNPGASGLWLGDDRNRMHLDRAQASKLAGIISQWVETGKLSND